MYPASTIVPIRPAPPPPPPKPRVEYTARHGDSLMSVARRFGVSDQQMAKSNPALGNPQQPLHAGTHLSIPVGNDPGQATVHTVRQGDDLADIAKQAGVSETDLRSANHLGPGQAVYPDRTLLIPAKDLDSKAPVDPASPDALATSYPELKKHSLEELKQISESAHKLRDGTFREKIAAAASLAKDLQPEQLPKLLQQLGVKDNAITKLATDTAALGAVSTLADQSAAAPDKIKAALTLTQSIGSLAPGKLGIVLKPYLSALPAGSALVDAISSYADPKASPLDKAKATLALANAVKDSAGEAFPQLASALRHTESFTKSIGAALTLLDPDASLKEKAEASLQLAANVPDMAGDARAIGKFLHGEGIGNTQQIVDEINRLPAASRLPDDLKKSIDPDVARSLKTDQVNALTRLAADGELKGDLDATLKQIKDPRALTQLLSSLDHAGDAAGKKALLGTLAGLRDGVANDLLTSKVGDKPAVDVLAQLGTELDPEARGNLTKLLKDFDGGALRSFLKISDKVDTHVLSEALGHLGGVDSNVAGTVLNGLDKVLAKAGVQLTGELATKLLKGVAKIIPLVGAAPAGYDAVQMAKVAADTSLPPNIRYMALQSAALNGADAMLSVAEPFIAEFGIPIAADVALGVVELGLDLVVSDQKAKFEADPAGYKPPAWMDTINVAMAGAQGPNGIAGLALIYGPAGTIKLVGSVADTSGKLAINVAQAQQQAQAQLAGDGLHYTATGLHVMADMIRHPATYGAAADIVARQAAQKLSAMAQGAGGLANAASKELGNLVGDLKNMGDRGVQALGWIASHPGEAAGKAIDALSNVAQQGINLGTHAGKAAARTALDALSSAKEALGAAGQAGAHALSAVDKALGDVVDSAAKLGKQGIQTLGWIAGHPGKAADIAKDALVDVAGKAGELAKDAYDTVTNLGKDGVQLAEAIAGKLEAAGEKGVEMLKYAIKHPGEAAAQVRQAATQALKNIANGVDDAARAATRALTDFVDEGLEEAKDTVTDLLTEGGSAARNIAAVWSGQLSGGAREVIGGLQDLGDAGAGALQSLAKGGVGFAGDTLGSIGGWAKRETADISPWW